MVVGQLELTTTGNRRLGTGFGRASVWSCAEPTPNRTVDCEGAIQYLEPMYCASCGSPNPECGKFCLECGNILARTKSELLRRTRNEKEPLLEVLQIDPKPNECHRCRAKTDLTRREFAIAKVMAVRREWGETAFRVGISAVSIVAAPLTGFGMFSWKGPKKTTSFTLFKAELVLCRSCLQWAQMSRLGTDLKEEAYRSHPWAEKARRIGYDKYLSADEVSCLKTIR